jgi:quercetin dioxygenase-like cupin family protein
MTTARSEEPKAAAVVRHIAEVPWQEFPGHFGGALSKPLVSAENCQARRIDHRISCYQPKAYVEKHVHKIQEQVYHVLEGEGLLELDGETRIIRKHDVVFVPPGVWHGVSNTGLSDLVFLVITSPPNDVG